MEEELLKTPNRRKVLYISDETGGSGKSTFVEQMALKYSNRVHIVPIASANQMALHMAKIERCEEKNIILFDVKKQQKFKNDKWLFIEELKDGKVTVIQSGKLEASYKYRKTFR